MSVIKFSERFFAIGFAVVVILFAGCAVALIVFSGIDLWRAVQPAEALTLTAHVKSTAWCSARLVD